MFGIWKAMKWLIGWGVKFSAEDAGAAALRAGGKRAAARGVQEGIKLATPSIRSAVARGAVITGIGFGALRYGKNHPESDEFGHQLPTTLAEQPAYALESLTSPRPRRDKNGKVILGSDGKPIMDQPLVGPGTLIGAAALAALGAWLEGGVLAIVLGIVGALGGQAVLNAIGRPPVASEVPSEGVTGKRAAPAGNPAHLLPEVVPPKTPPNQAPPSKQPSPVR